MKKVLSLILALVMCLSLCACGEKTVATTATLKMPNGSTEVMDAEEFIKKYQKNAVKYGDCDIVIEAVIERIKEDSVPIDGKNYASYVLCLEGNWEVEILQMVYTVDYAHLDVGDKVRVSSRVSGCFDATKTVFANKIHTDGTGKWVDETKVEVIG